MVLIQNPLNVGRIVPGCCSEGHLTYRQMDLPDKANCTSGRHEPYGYQGLPEGSVRKGYQGNRGGPNVAPATCRLSLGRPRPRCRTVLRSFGASRSSMNTLFGANVRQCIFEGQSVG